MGPFKLDADFLTIHYELKGRVVTHDCAQLRLEIHIRTLGAMVSTRLKKNILGAPAGANRGRNWDTGSHGKHQTQKTTQEDRWCTCNQSFLGFYGLFDWVHLLMVHRCLITNSCRRADAVRVGCNNSLTMQRFCMLLYMGTACCPISGQMW